MLYIHFKFEIYQQIVHVISIYALKNVPQFTVLSYITFLFS